MLLASYFFYGYWKLEFAALMAFTSIIDWGCALQIHTAQSKQKALFWLWLSILSNVAMLFMFKYFNFALGTTSISQKLENHQLTAWIIELGKYTIPAGISFYTFQSLSYIIDVYRKQEEPERNVLKFMLFVSFFPQLVAGPIERFGKLHSQLFATHSAKWRNISNGLRIALYGLFLKICIADNLANIVDTYYSNIQAFGTVSSWLAIFCFAFQVYADFFGYSLLAQGSALLFGIDLMDNFNKPYTAKSIPEFWHRWHISLSTWFKDYIFVPVGGNKKGPLVLAFAVLLVFFTSGLWHGAATTMILFGLTQGFLYLFDRFLFSKIKIQNHLWDKFKQLKTFVFFMLSLIYFRAESTDQPSKIWKKLWKFSAGEIDLNIPVYVVLFLLIFTLLDLYIMKDRVDIWLRKFQFWQRWLMYAFVIMAICIFGGATLHPFVYFQF